MKNLAPILEHLNRSRAHFLKTAREIPDKRWRDSPADGGWSAGEVIAHVVMVEAAIIARSKKVLQVSPQPVPLLKKIHLPLSLTTFRGRKVKSPIPLDPNLVSEKPAALDRLSATRKATLQFIESTQGRDLSAYRFPHPFLGSLNIYDWFRAIGYHERRHEKQIREIVENFHD
jgi:DinB superfamily